MRSAVVAVLALACVPWLSAQTGSTIQTATITLTASQLQNLTSIPVQVVPAPGPGQAIVDMAQQFQYKFGTVAYTPASCSDGKFAIYAGSNPSAAGFRLNSAGFLDQTTSQVASGTNTGTWSTPLSAAQNTPLMVANLGSADFAGGDGTVTITVYYTVVQLQ